MKYSRTMLVPGILSAPNHRPRNPPRLHTTHAYRTPALLRLKAPPTSCLLDSINTNPPAHNVSGYLFRTDSLPKTAENITHQMWHTSHYSYSEPMFSLHSNPVFCINPSVSLLREPFPHISAMILAAMQSVMV